MKALKITYWFTTIVLSMMSVLAGYMYLTNPEIQKGFHTMGFPDFFRVELAIAKFIGAITLLLAVPQIIKEWTYAGFGIVYVSALIAHIASGLSYAQNVMPVLFMILLVVSYLSYKKINPAVSSRTLKSNS